MNGTNNIHVKVSLTFALQILMNMLEKLFQTDDEFVYVATQKSLGGSEMPAVLTALGITSISFPYPATKDDIITYVEMVNDQSYCGHAGWLIYKKLFSLEKAKAYFHWAAIILFREWTTIANASGLWEGLFREVISSLEGKNRDFIFRLGDPVSKKQFELDEIIHIISNFSLYGRVSVVIDGHEAIGLWKALRRQPITLKQSVQQLLFPRKFYRDIFQMLYVDQLLIFFPDKIFVLQKNQEFNLTSVEATDRESAIIAAVTRSIFWGQFQVQRKSSA